MRIITAAALAATVAACGSAARSIPPAQLGESARDAYGEANTLARGWSGDARLRWLEGSAIARSGFALPGQGTWRFHYTAPGRAQELVVEVSPLETSTAERPVTSPPGYVLGDHVVGPTWIDSPAALSAVEAEAAPSTVEEAELMLVPMQPMQWIVRLSSGDARWRVDAQTGELLTQ